MRPGDQHRSDSHKPRGPAALGLSARQTFTFPHSSVVIHRPSSRMAHPIRGARVSTLAQKAGNAAVKVESSGEKSKTNLLTTTSALDCVTATAVVFAPAQLKHGGSICRTENAVNNYPGGKQC